MHTNSSRASPVVGAITTLVERWVSQDAARFNASQAATRLQHRRRQIDDVTLFLATQERSEKLDDVVPVTRDSGWEQRTSSGPP